MFFLSGFFVKNLIFNNWDFVEFLQIYYNFFFLLLLKILLRLFEINLFYVLIFALLFFFCPVISRVELNDV